MKIIYINQRKNMRIPDAFLVLCEPSQRVRIDVTGGGMPPDTDVLADEIAGIVRSCTANLVIMEDLPGNRHLASAIAYRLHARCLPDVLAVSGVNDTICFVRDTYQANMSGVYTLGQEPMVITVQSSKEPCSEISAGQVETVHTTAVKWNPFSVTPKELEPQSLFSHKTIVVCGHGAGKKEHVEEIVGFARRFGFGIGATRPVVTDGWISAAHLIGISGSSIAPDTCIVLGVSGSQAFMAGIAGSRQIIAVNSDSSAPIFQKCDYGIVKDCMEVVRNWMEG